MTHVVTAESNDTVRIEVLGGGATIRLAEDLAQLLYIQLPEKLRRQGEGRALLEAAEAEALQRGAKRMCCEYTDLAEGFTPFLQSCGYDIREAGHIISVSIEELLASTGVRKSMRMSFDDITTTAFEDLLMFEWEDVADMLNRFRFETLSEDMDRYDKSLSFVAYDKNYHPRAVLLTTMDEKLSVELLLGFSAKSSEYILCVCQKFAKALEELQKDGEPGRFYLYSCSEHVMALLKRLLDKKYTIKNEYKVSRGEKTLVTANDPPERELTERNDAFCWRGEAESVFLQRNISEKAVWMALRR